MSKLSPFDFTNSINAGLSGVNLLEHETADSSESLDLDSVSRQYNAFIINRAFSYFTDTIFLANVMNQYAGVLPAKMQYDFLRTAIRPRKRFSKWDKKTPNTKEVDLIMRFYKYSRERAQEVVDLFTPEQLADIESKLNTGGRK